MERGGGSHSSSWPATIRTPAHPQHELEYQLLPSNSCNLCCGDIAVADVLAVNYNHLQQQDYPSTDDDGEDNQRARDFGDLDGDDEPRYFGNADGNDEQRDIGNVDGDDEPSNFDIIDAGNYARDSADGDYYGSDMYD
ncbi:unnamed protein product [Urochloa humidicola]